MKIIIGLLVFLPAPTALQQEDKVRREASQELSSFIGITDGDTIKVLNDANTQIKVRIESIDCPESKQAFGAKAKQAMADMVFGKSVTVHKTGVDFFGRTLLWLPVA